MKKLELEKILSEGIVTVTFTKKDGSTRIMKCTSKLDLIPEEKRSILSEDEVVKESDHIVVYDVEAKGWRSFHMNKIIKLEYDSAVKIHYTYPTQISL